MKNTLVISLTIWIAFAVTSCVPVPPTDLVQKFNVINETADEWQAECHLVWNATELSDSIFFSITTPAHMTMSDSAYFLIREGRISIFMMDPYTPLDDIYSTNHGVGGCCIKTRLYNLSTGDVYQWTQHLDCYPNLYSCPDFSYKHPNEEQFPYLVYEQWDAPFEWLCSSISESSWSHGHHTFQCLINDSILNAAQTQRIK